MLSFFCCDWMCYGTVATGMLSLNSPPTVCGVLLCTCCISRSWVGGGAESQPSGQGRLACNAHSAELKGGHLIFSAAPSVPCLPSESEMDTWLRKQMAAIGRYQDVHPTFSPFPKKLQFISLSLSMQFYNVNLRPLTRVHADVCPFVFRFLSSQSPLPSHWGHHSLILTLGWREARDLDEEEWTGHPSWWEALARAWAGSKTGLGDIKQEKNWGWWPGQPGEALGKAATLNMDGSSSWARGNIVELLGSSL